MFAGEREGLSLGRRLRFCTQVYIVISRPSTIVDLYKHVPG